MSRIRPKGPSAWRWRPELLDPVIGKLASRPILVVPLMERTGNPLDYAKKRIATMNGSAAWRDSVHGAEIAMANATPASPSDYLSFPTGAYPTTSAQTVPHSIAVLYKINNNSNAHVPFSTGTGGGVAIKENGSSGFRITHVGVLDFTHLNFETAGHYYAQFYSYDQVVMNHLVIDLDSGAVQSQSIAETRALVTATGAPRVGARGANEVLQGSVVAAGWFRGAWSLDVMAKVLATNPTGLWTPRKRWWPGFVPSGVTPGTGIGSGQLPALAGSGTAEALAEGTGSGSLPAIVGAGTAEALAEGSGSGNLPALAGAGTAEAIAEGQGSGNLPALAGAGVAEALAEGTGSGNLPALTANGVGQIDPVSGTGSGSLPGLAGSGLAEAIAEGVGSGALPALAGAGAAEALAEGLLSGVLPILVGSGLGLVAEMGAGAGTLPALAGSGAGFVGVAIFAMTDTDFLPDSQETAFLLTDPFLLTDTFVRLDTDD